MTTLSALTHVPLAPGTARDTVLAAQAGDADAYEALLLDVLPNLRFLFGPAVPRLGRDGAESAAFLGFAEAVTAYDPKADPAGLGIVGTLAGHVRKVIAAEIGADTTTVSIPERTLSRFWSILRDCDGSFEHGVRLAPERGMTAATFRAVWDATRDYLDVDDAPSLTAPPVFVPESDKALVAHAFSAVNDRETDVVRLAYGFSDYTPVADAEIAARLGSTKSTIQRQRSGALVKMREALGVKG